MKYLALLAALVVICLVITRQSPVAGVQRSIAEADSIAPLPAANGAATPSPGTALKQPIDRTRAVLQQVKGRNGDGEF